MLASDFDYVLPEERIAQVAIEPRDASRLLVAADLTEIPFREVASLLDPGDVVVVNRTKVRAARLRGHRVDTGGAVELLLVRRLDPLRWEAMLRPSRRLRTGIEIAIGELTAELLSDPVAGVATLALRPETGVEEAIAAAGEVPLPPYFKGTLADPDRYQTIFAHDVGSAAAPTAALHFTDRVVASLEEKGIQIVEVELEVGLDTFRPMADGSVADHEIHTEMARVGPSAARMLNEARQRGGRIVAVGTTVVRTLETAIDADGSATAYEGPTSLFIAPGFRPRMIDALITNFHAPRTTLLVLIAAFLGETWQDVYRHAIESEFRFLSFGDAMYIEVERA